MNSLENSLKSFDLDTEITPDVAEDPETDSEESDGDDQDDPTGLEAAKRQIIARLMEEFYSLFKPMWVGRTSNYTASGTSTTQGGSISAAIPASSMPPFNNPRKRGSDERDSSSPNDDGNGRRKKPNQESPLRKAVIDKLFACPFYKHDPQKYRMNNLTGRTYRSCEGPGWKSTARIK
jgi:hypothetical protein